MSAWRAGVAIRPMRMDMYAWDMYVCTYECLDAGASVRPMRVDMYVSMHV